MKIQPILPTPILGMSLWIVTNVTKLGTLQTALHNVHATIIHSDGKLSKVSWFAMNTEPENLNLPERLLEVPVICVNGLDPNNNEWGVDFHDFSVMRRTNPDVLKDPVRYRAAQACWDALETPDYSRRFNITRVIGKKSDIELVKKPAKKSTAKKTKVKKPKAKKLKAKKNRRARQLLGVA